MNEQEQPKPEPPKPPTEEPPTPSIGFVKGGFYVADWKSFVKVPTTEKGTE